MGKLQNAIHKISPRLSHAVMVFRENPDDLVMITEREDGTVHHRHRFGVGMAANHRSALYGIAQMYGLLLGQPLHTEDTDGDGDES